MAKKQKKNNSSKRTAPQKTSAPKAKESLRKNFKIQEVFIWLIAITIFIIAASIRYYAFSMPVVGDESVYGILGKKAMMGADLYREIYEMKPPLLFYVYGFATTIFGWGHTGLRLAGLLLVLVNSFLIFAIARRYASLSFSAVVGATCFFLLNNLYAFATETAAELFYLAFALSGYYLLIHPRTKKLAINTFAAGFLIAGAAMIKQTAALFGVGAVLLIVWFTFSKNHLYIKKHLLKNIMFLAFGALTMIALNLIPIMISGTLVEAKYWLIDFPSKYATTKNLNDSWNYFEIFGKRILHYQFATIVLCLISVASIMVNFKAKYFPPFILLLLATIGILFPGFRFYSQYWIPLLAIQALFLISLKDALSKIKLLKKTGLIVSIATLTMITMDTINHKVEYFEKGYVVNAETAYYGNNAFVYTKMTEYVRDRMSPNQRFLMLGSQPFTYYAMDQFPSSNHIYPRLISGNTPENRALQHLATEEMMNGNQDYILFSITGLAWQSAAGGIDDLYQNAFSYVKNNYKPILAYNFDERKYYYNTEEDKIDIYIPDQLIAFKKK